MRSSIDFLLDLELLQKGYYFYIPWNFTKCPHILITGGTGSGKTYAVKLLLAKIGLNISDASITICDYKAEDFKSLMGCKKYYEFDDCLIGLDNFYNEFQARQKGNDSSRRFMLLCFDEYASFVNNLDKKISDDVKKKIATILMLGRSFNVHLIVSIQRADSTFFATGARDNFSHIIALGNLSKEAKQMLFTDYKEEMQESMKQGTGYMLDHEGLKMVQVPYVSDRKKLEHYIKKAVDN